LVQQKNPDESRGAKIGSVAAAGGLGWGHVERDGANAKLMKPLGKSLQMRRYHPGRAKSAHGTVGRRLGFSGKAP
jgi:hypothetical protein